MASELVSFPGYKNGDNPSVLSSTDFYIRWDYLNGKG